MAVVLVDKHGRFLGLESNDFQIKHVEYSEPNQSDVLTWNAKSSLQPHMGCSNCGSFKHLAVKCLNCNTRVYCSSACSAIDVNHRSQCIIAMPARMHVHHHSRFGPWVRTFSRGQYYNPLWYPSYRNWYRPWPKYQHAPMALPELPMIDSTMTATEIESELMELRQQHEEHRRSYGIEIVPDPIYGRFIWIKPVK